MSRYETIRADAKAFFKQMATAGDDAQACHYVEYDGDLIFFICGSVADGFRYHCPSVGIRKYNVSYQHVQRIMDEEAASASVVAKLVMHHRLFDLGSYSFRDCIILADKARPQDANGNVFLELPKHEVKP